MNAGSAQRWIGECIQNVEVLRSSGDSMVLRQTDIHFSYRKSSLENLIITGATLQFPKVDVVSTRNNLDEYAKKRRATQDLGYPSCGCMFMNPVEIEKSAGQLIDECGLKGVSVGGAMISKIHANFLVNTGGATAKDVYQMMNIVKKAVKEKFDIELHQEMKYISDGAL